MLYRAITLTALALFLTGCGLQYDAMNHQPESRWIGMGGGEGNGASGGTGSSGPGGADGDTSTGI